MANGRPIKRIQRKQRKKPSGRPIRKGETFRGTVLANTLTGGFDIVVMSGGTTKKLGSFKTLQSARREEATLRRRGILI